MNAIRSSRFLLSVLVSFTLVTNVAQPAAPRDELLRLVPDDVAFCLVVQNLRDYWAAVAESPMAKELKASSAAKTIGASPELAKLGDLEQFLKLHLGTDFAQLRDDILGDALVFAFRPGPPGKPDQDQGLFLIRSRSEKALGNLVDRLNKAQQAFGELKKLEERQHNGVTYFARIERNQPPSYYALRGPVLIFSPHEAMLQRAIDRDRQEKPADAALPALTRQFRQLGADSALFAGWINPRAFDAEVRQRAEMAKGPEAAFLKTFGRYWDALEGIVFSVAAAKDLEFNLAVRLKPEALSPAARKFLAEGARTSELWNAFPRDAIFATAGRCDVPALLELCSEFLDDDTRKAMRDSLQQGTGPVLAKAMQNLVVSLGPDAGMYLTAPATGPAWFPEGVWAIRVRPGPDGKPVDQPLLDALNFFANLAVLDHNSKNADRLTLKAVQQNEIDVKYFVNDKLPPGLQPAFGIKEGYFIFATSPDVLRRFAPRAAKAPDDTAEVPLWRFSPAALRGYLKDRREALVSAIAEKDRITKDEAARRFDELVTGLGFADTIELVQRPSSGQVILTLRIKPTQPLRK
ncbi:hypothetical protein AYO44_04075 [Planctomycetaceae bacterium SCGC AG-212-F19]|nr:hypothetical protein AYO44_04075 [Planctomycetaceae bacterium SCGC AG-212-F19]